MKAEQRKYFFVLFVLLSLGLVHLYFNAQNIAIKYKITENKVTLNDLRANNRMLGNQVAKMQDPENISKKAAGLNMYFPAKITYIAASLEKGR